MKQIHRDLPTLAEERKPSPKLAPEPAPKTGQVADDYQTWVNDRQVTMIALLLRHVQLLLSIAIVIIAFVLDYLL